MDFTKFVAYITAKLQELKLAVKATFLNDKEKGLFRAEVDDVVFTAPRGGNCITANWGSGHCARFYV